MREEIIRFGSDSNLVGVLNLPHDGSPPNRHRPIAVLLNAGIVHRVGPYRLHVDIARQLANAGFASCRIDLSGLGDSPTRSNSVDAQHRVIQDGQELFEALQRSTGADRFVLMGLCSGSYHAHQLARFDSRVIGGVFMDGLTFPTSRHFWRVFRKKLSYRFLRNALKRRLLKLMPTEQRFGSESQPVEFGFIDQHEDAPTIAGEIRQLLERGNQLMFIYTGGNPDFSAEAQFSEMFAIPMTTQGIQIHYLPKSEHTFPLVQSRNQVVDLIVQWYQQKFQSKEQLVPQAAGDETGLNNLPLSLNSDAGQSVDWISPWTLPPSPLAVPRSII